MLKVYLKGNDVQILLATKSLSQNWLAKRIGISSGFMSQLIQGKRCASADTRKKFFKYFKNKEFDDLFYLDGQETNLD